MAPAAETSSRTRQASPGPAQTAAGAPVCGIGLTPRLFKELVGTKDATFDAQPAAYVKTISRHVQSVAPSKQVMAENYVPIVVATETGERRVLHADPLAVRKFRRTVAEELRFVREKRRRMSRRMADLRQELPKPRDLDVAQGLEQEIANAEAKVQERLVRPLPPGTRSLQVLVEASPDMVQLALVCEHLLRELPSQLAEAGCTRVSLAALGGASTRGRDGERPPAALEDAAPDEAQEWLQQLAAAATGSAGSSEGPPPPFAGLRLAPSLRRAANVNAEGGQHAVLLLASSPPDDLDACLAAVEGQRLSLQVVGVFGAAPDDPEPTLQQLVDASAEASSLHLFFGREYWAKFAAARRRQLARVRARIEAERQAYGPEREEEDGDVVSPKVFEVRLIERIMRECYVEEQMCEEELVCAGRLLERSLVDHEDVKAAMRPAAQAPKSGSRSLGVGVDSGAL